MASLNPCSRISEVAAPFTNGMSPTSPSPPMSRASSWPAARAPATLSVATNDTGSSDLTPESIVTTGIPASLARRTTSIMALSSQAAITRASTSRVMKSSMILSCLTTSVSLSGPFQYICTFKALAASSAPAFTVSQKSWVVPLGMTAMVYLASLALPLPGSAFCAACFPQPSTRTAANNTQVMRFIVSALLFFQQP